MSDWIGKQLGPYKILSSLGAGPIGHVFRATHLSLPQNVAIKVLNPQLTGGEDFRSALMEHAQALTSPALKHPAIIETYHFGDENGVFYTVTELVTGGSLNTSGSYGASVAERTAEFLEGVNHIQQIAEALALINNENLVHGGIKPTNILLSQAIPGGDSSAKVGDIGLTRLVTEVRRSNGTIADSPYLSPEQRSGSLSDKKSDIYSLGAVMYEITTRRPFQQAQTQVPGSSELQIIPPSQMMMQFPKELELIIMRCLMPSPGGRYDSAAELAQALSVYLSKNGYEKKNKEQAPIVAPLEAGDMPPAEPEPIQAAVPTIQVMDRRNNLIETKPLSGSGVLIGSGPGNTITLRAENGVSANHVRIDWDGNQVIVRDQGSKEGTRLKGHELFPQIPQAWPKKEWLQVGRYWIWLHAPGHVVPILPVDVLLDESNRIMTLTPGTPSTCRVILVNQKPQVDEVHLSVDGFPPKWVEGTFSQVRLQAHGGKKEVQLTIKIPKDASARAGDYNVQIRAHSTAQKAVDQGFAQATWKVLPFDIVSMSVTPPKLGGRRLARYNVNFRQDGTGEPSYTLSASTDDNDEKQLDFLFVAENSAEETKPKIHLQPGSTKTVKFKLNAPRRWLGTAAKSVVTVHAQAEDGSVLTKEAHFSHRAIFPPWTLVAAPVLLVGLYFLMAYFYKPRSEPEVWITSNQAYLTQGEPFTVHWNAAPSTSLIKFRVDGTDQDFQTLPVKGDREFPGTMKASISIEMEGENLFGKSPTRSAPFTFRPPPPKPEADIDFRVEPEETMKGGYVTLIWDVKGGNTVQIDTIGTVPAKGKRQVQIDATKEFTLHAKNPDGVETASTVRVTVGVPSPNIIQFSAFDPKQRSQQVNQFTINQGERLEFRWQTKNAKSLRIDALKPTMLDSGTGHKEAEFEAKGKYTVTLVITNEDGTEYRSNSIEVIVNCTFSSKAKVIVGKGCSEKRDMKWQ